MRPSAGILCLAIRCDWRSGSLKKLVEVALAGSKIRLASWLSCVIYFADQLLTPYFSGARTLNGTPGGDGWAQVLGGQICWLSEPLHRFDADCSGSTSLKMQTHGKHEKLPPHRNTHHETHIHTATVPTTRRHAKKHAPCVSPCSLASIDSGFVEIGLAQLSQSVKTTNVTHIHTD